MPQKKCSFCGRSEKDVKLLITGLNGYICEDCAQQAYKIVTQTGALADDENTDSVAFKVKEVPKPKEIKQYLDLVRMKLSAIFLLQCITITSDFSNRRVMME